MVAPKDIVLNGLVTRAHIRGLKGHYELRFKNTDIACGSGLQRGLGLDKHKQVNKCLVGIKSHFHPA